MNLKNILFVLFTGVFLVSCSEEFQKKLEVTPKALGSANEIVVIADKDIWEGEIGDTLRYIYESAYPMLPAPEAIFNLRHYTIADLEASRLRKELRTYLYLADLSDANSPTTKAIAKDIGEEKVMTIRNEGSTSNVIGRDKWAVGQIVIYLAGKDKEDLINNISKSFSSISKRVYEHDYKQISQFAYASGYNKGLANEIEENLGVEIQVPADFIKAKWVEEADLIWIRKETSVGSFSKVLRIVDYTDQSQFTVDYVKGLVNEFGEEHVRTNTPGSHFVVNDEDLPTYSNTKEINGQYTLEIRGIWETTQDYMGGPYFAYLIMDKSQKKALFVLDFIYAPGKEKRDLMQQMELMTGTIKFSELL